MLKLHIILDIHIFVDKGRSRNRQINFIYILNLVCYLYVHLFVKPYLYKNLKRYIEINYFKHHFLYHIVYDIHNSV